MNGLSRSEAYNSVREEIQGLDRSQLSKTVRNLSQEQRQLLFKILSERADEFEPLFDARHVQNITDLLKSKPMNILSRIMQKVSNFFKGANNPLHVPSSLLLDLLPYNALRTASFLAQLIESGEWN